jgi:DNA-binding transcriptional ArsR family regulator
MMARTPTTYDSFNAIAEPKRRQVLEVLIEGELPVNDLVNRLGWKQPTVSKHLGVLKEVGLVSMRKHGRQRVYKLEGEQLKPLHDWLTKFEQLWGERFDRLDGYLQDLQQKGNKDDE